MITLTIHSIHSARLPEGLIGRKVSTRTEQSLSTNYNYKFFPSFYCKPWFHSFSNFDQTNSIWLSPSWSCLESSEVNLYLESTKTVMANPTGSCTYGASPLIERADSDVEEETTCLVDTQMNIAAGLMDPNWYLPDANYRSRGTDGAGFRPQSPTCRGGRHTHPLTFLWSRTGSMTRGRIKYFQSYYATSCFKRPG